ncbi:hypothetical protein Acsp06_20440 [Actinomycetospora sp. NBRC 106375]|uniref:DUF6247 family protein n=1 Tax=Actinomycetospora sp. NBRC 106375 TaxID=3032207 RepID=UPI0024A451E3|nr:DUF6247 family protein [Actinomycetospora sp. NBRC 106375]GLZ45859.1 hypothetical protein Acsp06_20440 [Actinomycetospora sp. NBRC 106375]
MTTTYSVDDEPADPAAHPLSKGASPDAIRASLAGPDDRAEFDAALAAALDEVKASLDLTELFRMLDQWRRIAVLQSDPERFRRVARRAAEVNIGRPGPEDEPLAEARGDAGI